MIVNLGESIAMAVAALAAETVSFDNAAQYLGRSFFHPRQKGRPEVETHPRVIVQQIDDLALAVHEAGTAVWSVTLSADALSPVVEWSCRVLNFDRLQPRIFARRLVKVSVDAQIAWFTFAQVNYILMIKPVRATSP